MNKTCLSYWFPKIKAAGAPVPKTTIIDFGHEQSRELLKIFDVQSPPELVTLTALIRAAADEVGYPCFLRTGQTSGKHGWKDNCFLADPLLIPQHIAGLVEFSEICDFMGLPFNVWVVRELLKTRLLFRAFHGEMPIVREFRVFVQGAEVACLHPYWPEGCFELFRGSDEWPEGVGRNCHVDEEKYPLWRVNLEAMNTLDHKEMFELTALAEKCGGACGGDWSVDILQDENGKWWVTDMAEANISYHWPGCVNEKKFSATTA